MFKKKKRYSRHPFLEQLCRRRMMNSKAAKETPARCLHLHQVISIPSLIVKRQRDATQWLCSIFSETCCCHQIQDEPIFCHEISKCLTLKLWHIFNVLLWIKYCFMRFVNNCLLFSFMFHTAFLLFFISVSKFFICLILPIVAIKEMLNLKTWLDFAYFVSWSPVFSLKQIWNHEPCHCNCHYIGVDHYVNVLPSARKILLNEVNWM